MPCISPLTLVQKGKRNTVPCGKCNYCLQANRAQWSFRLRQELKVAETAHFLTLTYDDAELPLSPSGIPELRKEHVQLFMKRLRKNHAKTGKTIWKGTKYAHRSSKWPSLRYYFVGEYGTKTDRPHYHAIMFNLHQDTLGTLADIWGQGHVQLGNVNAASIHYVTKYVVNRHGDYETKAKPFANISKGIGKNYLINSKWHIGTELKNYAIQDEHKVKLPRYYTNKIFDEYQKIDLRFTTKSKMLTAENKEIKRLKKIHPNPLGYLNERLNANHELIGKRVNEKNKF